MAAPGGYLIEFQRVGSIVRVSAIDPATNTEVVIQGPASAGQETLSRAAVNKLRFVLARGQQGGPASPPRTR
ncbi:DUF6898 family protein [Rhodocista pekingensis]|uniref:DUF6898 family protein n=1 Tax=Rhodocista pekingensis TaxID=201185 RepID=A0ABW2KST5_9PROT